MTVSRQSLEQLVRLAKDPSPDGRKALAATINDLFAAEEGDLSARELALINDILEKLLRSFETLVRRELAERLAMRKTASHNVMVALANDEIEVARPVLLHSPILHDAELIDIVRAGSNQHQMAIAMRAAVSEQVAQALVETADGDVIISLLHNHGAKIAYATMSYLVAESRRVDSYQEPLVLREDLGCDLAKRIHGWVSDSLRGQILARFELDPADLDQGPSDQDPSDQDLADPPAAPAAADAVTSAGDETAPAAAAATASDGDETAPAAGWRQVTASERLAQILAESREITPNLLIQILRDGKIDLFEAMFGRWTKLEPPYLQEVLHESDGKTFAIACRALGVPKNRFIQLHLLMQSSKSPATAADPQELGRAVGYYDRITTEAARDVMQRWQDLSQEARAPNAAGHGG